MLPASAQLDSTQLGVKFGAPALQILSGKLSREVFGVPPGFDLVVDYGAGNLVCKLHVTALMPTDAKVQNTDDMKQKMHAFLAELVPNSMRGKETGRSQGTRGPAYTVSTGMYEQVAVTEVARARLATNFGNYPYGNPVGGSNTITAQFSNVACQQPSAQ